VKINFVASLKIGRLFLQRDSYFSPQAALKLCFASYIEFIRFDIWTEREKKRERERERERAFELIGL